MAHSNPDKSWPISKNWPKMSKRLVFRDFIAFAYTNFLYGESKNLKKNYVFASRVLKVSVAALVKFALSRVKSVTFLSHIFISYLEDFDLFGGFTDLVMF